MTDATQFPLVVNRRRSPDDRRHGDRRKDGTHPALDLPMPVRHTSARDHLAAAAIDVVAALDRYAQALDRSINEAEGESL